MRALAALLVAVAVPAAACPPMRTRIPVDPVVAIDPRSVGLRPPVALPSDSLASGSLIEDRLRDGTPEDLREVVKSAQWIARQRSRQPDQRARALALAASARYRLGETRAATLTMERAFAVDRAAARKIMVPDALLAAAGVPIEELLDPT